MAARLSICLLQIYGTLMVAILYRILAVFGSFSAVIRNANLQHFQSYFYDIEVKKKKKCKNEEEEKKTYHVMMNITDLT